MKNKFLKKCLEIAVIVIGNAILAFGICAFITPHGIIVKNVGKIIVLNNVLAAKDFPRKK